MSDAYVECGAESIFGERCQREAGHEGRHRSRIIGHTWKDAIRLDEQGRVVFSPAIAKLVDAVRASLAPENQNSFSYLRDEALRAALAEVDAEAKGPR